MTVPWSGFDLINAFNRWKTSESAGRVFVVAPDGTTIKLVTAFLANGGLRPGVRGGRRRPESRPARYAQRVTVGSASSDASARGATTAFVSATRRIQPADANSASGRFILVGYLAEARDRSHDDTRRLRRMLRPVTHLDPRTGDAVMGPPARVLSATVRRRVDRWYVCLNLEAPDYHRGLRHHSRSHGEGRRFVGIDRGLAASRSSQTQAASRSAASTPLDRQLADVAGSGGSPASSRAPSAVPRTG